MVFELATADEILRELGSRIRGQRLAQNLTHAEVARMAGLSIGALRHLEIDGKCSFATLVRVTQSLGLAAEFAPLFVLKRLSIADMEKAAATSTRQRASKGRRR